VYTFVYKMCAKFHICWDCRPLIKETIEEASTPSKSPFSFIAKKYQPLSTLTPLNLSILSYLITVLGMGSTFNWINPSNRNFTSSSETSISWLTEL